MAANDFIDCVRKGKPYFQRNSSVIKLGDFDWVDWIQFVDEHPYKNKSKDIKLYKKDKQGIELRDMDQRQSLPKFAKMFIEVLSKQFTKNKVTCIGFCGFTENNKSFKIHRDKMDVLYMQILGTVQLSLWKEFVPSNKLEHADQSDVECFFKETMKRGQWLWIPRGTFHLIEPLESRLGFSFGVEGSHDPKTYI